ncbi:MAG TPA: copper chaperone PCu(A)C [Burkholderiales bacterium]|nr:copper chaperone PCu(A)C [Burkholderiales bacterium]
MIPVSKWQILAVCGVLGCFLVAVNAQAQTVEIKDAWIRGTVAGQKASGAFMSLTSRAQARLVAAASPVAGVVEIHSMKMDGGVMRMFAVDGIDLPANRTVKLAPGGYHVMLMDIRRTLNAGERVPMKLTVELAGGKRETIELDVEVRTVSGAPKHGH